MIPSEVYALGASGNPIREIADYAMRRAEEVGAENVYDFSIGSPSIAPPVAVQETAQRLMKEMSPTQLHAYSPDQGLPEVRKAVAEYLNGAFSMAYAPEDIYMTSGASAGLAIGCRALLSPGDECITLTPYFPNIAPIPRPPAASCARCPANRRRSSSTMKPSLRR